MLLLKNYPLLGYEFHIISCSIFMLNINSSILSFKFSFFFFFRILIVCFHLQTYLEELVRQAYANWDSLEVVDEVLNETALLTQGI